MTPAEREALDVLGPVLCRLSNERVNLSWQGAVGPVPGFYHIDWRDEHGCFFSGAGDTPSEAMETARAAADRPIPLTKMIAGCVVDAEAA